MRRFLHSTFACGLLVVEGLLLAPGLAAAGDASERAVLAEPGGVLAIRGGELLPEPAQGAPPGVELVFMVLEPDGAAFAARLTFAGPFEQLTSVDGVAAQHIAFVSLQPPDGDRLRVALRPDGSGTLERAEGDTFVEVEPIEPVIEGAEVLLPIPASVGLGPGWEVQPHVLLAAEDGGGFHAHGPQVPFEALAGEEPVVPMPAQGSAVAAGVPVWWEPTVEMPAGTRPVSVALEQEGDRVIAVVAMDAPPAPLADVNGEPVAGQFVEVLVSSASGEPSYAARYDVLTGGASYVSPEGEPIADAEVVTDGSTLRFDLGEAPSGTGLGAIKLAAAVSQTGDFPDAGPVNGGASFKPETPGCEGFGFPLTANVQGGVMEILFSGGPTSSGPIQPDGSAVLTSPDANPFEFESIIGKRLIATHIFGPCEYTVVVLLDEALAKPLPVPPPGPIVTVLDLGSLLNVASVVVDGAGDGFGMFGVGVSVSETLLVDIGSPPPPGGVIVEGDDGGIGIGALLGIGVGVVVIIVGGVVYVVTKKDGEGGGEDPCPELLAEVERRRAALEALEREHKTIAAEVEELRPKLKAAEAALQNLHLKYPQLPESNLLTEEPARLYEYVEKHAPPGADRDLYARLLVTLVELERQSWVLFGRGIRNENARADAKEALEEALRAFEAAGCGDSGSVPAVFTVGAVATTTSGDDQGEEEVDCDALRAKAKEARAELERKYATFLEKREAFVEAANALAAAEAVARGFGVPEASPGTVDNERGPYGRGALGYLLRNEVELGRNADEVVSATEAYFDAVERMEEADLEAGLWQQEVRAAVSQLKELVQELASRCGDAAAQGLLDGVPEIESEVKSPREEFLPESDRPQVFGPPGETGPVDPVM